MKSYVRIPVRELVQPMINAVDIQSDRKSFKPDQWTTNLNRSSCLIRSHLFGADWWVYDDQ